MVYDKEREKKKFGVKYCKICKMDKEINYKDVEFLKLYVGSGGRLRPRMHTGNCAKHQREITRAVKRARILAFIPFTT